MTNNKNLKTLIEVYQNNAKCDEHVGIGFINSKEQCDDEFYSYRELYDMALHTLGKFQDMGMKKGSELIFQLQDNSHFIICFMAAILGGILPIPIGVVNNEETKLRADKIWGMLCNPYIITSKNEGNVFIQEKIEEKAVICYIEDGLEYQELGSVAAVEENDIAFIQYSSGSTGKPKGVQLSHKNIIADVTAIIERGQLDEHTIQMAWMPLSHDMGLIGFHLMPSVMGNTHYLMTTGAFIANPVKWIDRVNHYQITTTASPNFGYAFFVKNFKEEDAIGWNLSCVKNIFNGAEPISSDVCSKFLNILKPYGLEENTMSTAYGLAEATVAVTITEHGEKVQTVYIDRTKMEYGDQVCECAPEDENAISLTKLGKAISCCEIRICVNDEVVDEGTIGLVQVKGNNVSSGYYKNVTETKITFLGDWLNTGDMGFMQDGNLIVTGRLKEIIFLNGQNFYPHDIERVCEQMGDTDILQTVAVGVYDEELGREQIVLFVKSKKTGEDFEIQVEHLREYIMLKMGLIINTMIPIDEIPKTESGKIRRLALVEEYKNSAQMRSVKKQSRNNLSKEMKLADIWNGILGTKTASIDESFLTSGGNSLKIVQMIAEIYKEFNVELTIREFFEHSTIKQLSDCISRKQTSEYFGIQIAEEKDKYLVSSAQKRIYLLSQMDPQSLNYNITSLYLLKGNIDDYKVQECFQQLTNRHESLRTQFIYEDDRIYQRIMPELKVQIESVQCKQEELQWNIERTVQPFDLSKAPLFRIKILHLNEKLHVLIFDAHHIILDGSSEEIIYREFLELYQGKNLEPVALQYRDYSEWDNMNQKSQSYSKALEYWKKEFAQTVEPLDIASDFLRPSSQQYEGNTIKKSLKKDYLVRLKEFSAEHNATMYMVLLSAFYVFLYKYSGQKDLVVGTPIAGRKQRELENTVGMFVNTLPLKSNVMPDAQFDCYLQSIKENVLLAFDSQEVPFDTILDFIGNKRVPGRNPLFDVMFVLQNFAFQTEFEGEEIRSNYQEYTNHISKFDFTLSIQEKLDGLTLSWEYSTRLFKQETASKMLEQYTNVLAQILNQPSIVINEIELLNETQKEECLKLSEGEKLEVDYNQTAIAMFEQTVLQYPDRIAITFGGESITYEELHRKVNCMGKKLLSYGLAPNSTIAVIDEASIEAICGFLAILKAGYIYLPIAPDYPTDRMNYMISDSKAQLALVRTKLPILLDSERQLLLKDEFVKASGDEELSEQRTPRQLAYVIYTSGTTGNPKGVMIEQRSLTNQLQGLHQRYDFTGRNHVLMSPLTFDPSIQQILLPLTTGSTLYLIHREMKLEIPDFVKFLSEERINVLNAVPSIINSIVSSDEDLQNIHLDYLILAGEEFTVPLYRKIVAKLSVKKIINIYGPTEATINAALFECDKNKEYTKIPIGRPLMNYQIFVLNQDMQLLPPGVPGELYIGGVGLAKGYLNSQELTEERFVCAPWNKECRLYRTGDMGKWLPDGNLEFNGRDDEQVKIRGMRIELGEIQKHLQEFEGIKEAVVINYKADTGNVFLCAYLVKEKSISEKELREYLKKRLPDYMVPSRFVSLEELPLTAHEKLDKKRLPNPEEAVSDTRGCESATTDVEKLLVEVWKEVLGINDVGVRDNFIECGGDSIKAIQVVSKLKRKGLEIKVKDIFETEDIRDLSLRLEKWEAKIEENISGDISLTPVHKWFFEREGSKNHFNQAVLLESRERLSIESIISAINALVDHHDSLRIRCRKQDGMFSEVYENGKDNIANIEEIYLQDHEEQSHADVIASQQSSLDLEAGPIMKALILHGKQQDMLVLIIHHLVVDGVSWRILLEDFVEAYHQAKAQTPIRLQDKTTSYKKWADKLFLYAKERISEQERKYWDRVNEQIGNATGLIPDYKQDRRYHKDMTSVVRQFTQDETAILSEAIKGVGGNELLLAALFLTFRKCTGNNTLGINLEGHGRETLFDDVDLSRTVGWFTSMYPVMLSVEEEDDKSVILQVKKILQDIPRKGIGYGLLKYLGDRVDQYQNTPEISFNYLGEIRNPEEGEFEHLVFLTDNCIGKDFVQEFALDINCMINEGSFFATFGYNKMEYEKNTIENFANRYIEILKNLANYCRNHQVSAGNEKKYTYKGISQEDLLSLNEKLSNKEAL